MLANNVYGQDGADDISNRSVLRNHIRSGLESNWQVLRMKFEDEKLEY